MQFEINVSGAAPCRLQRRNAFRRAGKPYKLRWSANSRSRHPCGQNLSDAGSVGGDADSVISDRTEEDDVNNDSGGDNVIVENMYRSACDLSLLISDETDPQKYLEKKEINKGASGKQFTGSGGVLWPLGENVFTCEDQQVVAACFRYYHGPSAVCRAVSPVVQLCKTSQAQQEVGVGLIVHNAVHDYALLSSRSC